MSEFDHPNCSKRDAKNTADISPFHIPRTDRQDDAHTNRIYLQTSSLPEVTTAHGDGNGQILVWSLSNGNLVDTVHAHNDSVSHFGRDARTFVSSSRDRTAKLWQFVGDGPEQMRLRHQHTLNGHTWPIMTAQFHKDRVITTSKDSVRLWRVEDGSCLEVISNFASICEFETILTCERLQLVGACSNSEVNIYDLTDKTETACLRGHIGVARVVKLLASPSVPGHKIISAGYGGTVRTWALDPGDEVWQNAHVLSFSDAVLTPFGDEIDLVEVEGEEFFRVEKRAKRIFDMKIDGIIAYVVGEGAEIVAFDLGEWTRKHEGGSVT
ncbi:WD40 repeat-like protein [Polyplosphaeria fusca]|uniref:WD40 repeat-like protein n=1 Tax=Polyplosphaeria fusca TaxID=682080 RepID=A0A9P4R6B0_9PLEO|nr:WD40 repeat-like protein [Polyplosphaeria fusca]